MSHESGIWGAGCTVQVAGSEYGTYEVRDSSVRVSRVRTAPPGFPIAGGRRWYRYWRSWQQRQRSQSATGSRGGWSRTSGPPRLRRQLASTSRAVALWLGWVGCVLGLWRFLLSGIRCRVGHVVLGRWV